MKPEKLLDALNDIDSDLIAHARTTQFQSRRPKFSVLVAAVIAIAALTLTAFASEAISGWFKEYFEKRSDAPLTSEQIQYIEENEQVIEETKAENSWTVELKSAITDGKTGFILFGITAPEGIDLESNLGRNIFDGDFITPGNDSMNNHIKRRRALIVPSTGPDSKELNYIWQRNTYWEADNDGLKNTLNYMIEIQCDKLYQNQACLLEEPFGKDVTFNVRFIDFTYEYQDPEIKKALEEKYAGRDNYLIGGEEIQGLHKSDILLEGEWEFNIVFGMDEQDVDRLELVTAPIPVSAIVSRWMGEDHLTCDIEDNLETINLTSFQLTSFGAVLQFEEDETISGVSIECQNRYGYEDRLVHVVMEDGSTIPLHTDGVGTNLASESPIVLREVDHVLLADGTKLMVP